MAEAVRAELLRRRKVRLIQSLQKPHPEAVEVAVYGFREWVAMAAEGDSDLIGPARLRPIHWEPGIGWKDGSWQEEALSS